MPGIRTAPFGHLGDGNIHYNAARPQDMNEQDFIDLVNRAVDSQENNSVAKEYAAQNDWEHSYKLMLNAL